MESSKPGFRAWAIAIFPFVANRKGISSGRLRREPEVKQRTARFPLHRLRDAGAQPLMKFTDLAEADETHIGGKVGRMNRHQRRRWRRKAGGARGSAGKTPVICIRDGATGKSQLAAVFDTSRETLQRFVPERTVPGTTVHTDDASSCKGPEKAGRKHRTVSQCRRVGPP